MNQPQQPNPGLGGGQLPQQPAQQQSQQPSQTPGYSGLVGPDQRPLRPLAGLPLTPGGPQVPVPVGPEGQLTPQVSHDLRRMGGNDAHPHIVMTWVEVYYAFAMRDEHIAWLERRIVDLERQAGTTPISPEKFMEERQQAHYEAMRQAQAEQQAQATQPPPMQQGQPAQQPVPQPQMQQGQPPQQPPQESAPQQPPPGHGMPVGPGQ